MSIVNQQLSGNGYGETFRIPKGYFGFRVLNRYLNDAYGRKKIIPEMNSPLMVNENRRCSAVGSFTAQKIWKPK
ncbi:MAG: hypothetical protein C0490_04070 [Marivirga sp.]|nr:hypothetical protein [Marivirga sp.]